MRFHSSFILLPSSFRTSRQRRDEPESIKTVPIKAIKANLPQRSHLKAAPQGFTGYDMFPSPGFSWREKDFIEIS